MQFREQPWSMSTDAGTGGAGISSFIRHLTGHGVQGEYPWLAVDGNHVETLGMVIMSSNEVLHRPTKTAHQAAKAGEVVAAEFTSE
jgi:hypothetical protein